MRIWPILLGVTLGCAAGITLGASPAAMQNTPASADQRPLPDGEGHDLLTARCLVCHADTLIREQRLAGPAWGREVDKMIGWGTVLDATERGQVVAYLTKYFGPSTDAGAPAEGDSAALVSRCLGCHDTRLIETQRLSAAGWRREIDKMVGWGASLSEPERDRLSDDLSRRYPR